MLKMMKQEQAIKLYPKTKGELAQADIKSLREHLSHCMISLIQHIQESINKTTDREEINQLEIMREEWDTKFHILHRAL